MFDASGVTVLKKGGLFGGDKTPLDKADLPERERKSLVAQLGIPLSEVPHDYGEYVRFLGQKGIELYANQTMMLLYKIGNDENDYFRLPTDLDVDADGALYVVDFGNDRIRKFTPSE